MGKFKSSYNDINLGEDCDSLAALHPFLTQCPLMQHLDNNFSDASFFPS